MKHEEMRKAKIELRKQMRRLRKSLSSPEQKSDRAASILTSLPIWKKASHILIYSAVGSELSTRPLFNLGAVQNVKLYLPVTIDEDGEMGVGLFKSDTELEIGNFQIPEPKLLPHFDLSIIDLVIVPGIAFTEMGHRLGQGKGYYDRFLNQLNATTVGYCFEEQIIAHIPTEEHDFTVEFLVTDTRSIQCFG